MNEPRKDQPNRYEELMRNAGARKRMLGTRMVATERRFRIDQKRPPAEGAARVEHDLRLHAEQLHVKAKIKSELKRLKLELDATTDSDERVLLKAEMVHLQSLKSNLGFRPPRKPPESGMPVPAVPPKGPLPKQGGAEAPLEFD